eukprot:12663800-Alexandrium_andersonii.AAC.1
MKGLRDFATSRLRIRSIPAFAGGLTICPENKKPHGTHPCKPSGANSETASGAMHFKLRLREAIPQVHALARSVVHICRYT